LYDERPKKQAPATAGRLSTPIGTENAAICKDDSPIIDKNLRGRTLVDLSKIAAFATF